MAATFHLSLEIGEIVRWPALARVELLHVNRYSQFARKSISAHLLVGSRHPTLVANVSKHGQVLRQLSFEIEARFRWFGFQPAIRLAIALW